MEYMSDQETPTVYDLACALWILSNVLGRNCIVDRPRASVHLNMYVILVSESGIMRKSTSIRHATSLLRLFFDLTQNPTQLVESKSTAGAILSELHTQSTEHNQAHMVFVASELAAAFGRGTGIGNLTALLTDLYDCPDVRSGGGSLAYGKSTNVVLKNVYMGFLGGTTPSWLANAVTPTIIEGGFTSRCYFIVGRQRKRSIAWPSESTGDARIGLLKQLKEIKDESNTFPRMGIDKTGQRTFTNWYNERTIHKDTYRESFESREDGHVLRLAGLFAANEQCWLLSDDHIRRAIEFVGDVKSAGASLFTGSVNRKSLDLKWISRLRDVLLKRADGIPRMELTRTMNAKGLRTHELQSTLTVMHELGLLTKHEVSYEGMPGRPKTVYKPTIYLENEAFLADVTRKMGIEH